MQITPRRRRAIATALAFVLAIESVSAVAAAGITATTLRDMPSAAPAPVASAVFTASPEPKARVSVASAFGQTPTGRRPAATRTTVQAAGTTKPSAGGHVKADRPAHRVKTAPTRTKAASHRATPRSSAAGKRVKTATFAGRNHVWIPALGMNRSISSFACSRTREPDNYVYRWGCAGTNNVYLLGHAWGVFKPLHDAYTHGRLRVGMKVWYADSRGHVTAYAVRWWKLVKPTTAASWAWAAQSTPSMTLQTCVGALSQNRLMVRLTAAD